jgi:cell division protein FtsB
MQKLFVKLGSFYALWENFCLTQDAKARFTKKSESAPNEFFGRTIQEDGKRLQEKETERSYRPIRLPEAREHVRRAGQYVLQAAEEYQPVVHRAFSLRRKIGTILAAALAVWLFFHVVLGANGALAYDNKRNEYKTLEKDVDQLQEQNEQLRKHIEALKGDPAAIEREAREQLHYAKPGEIVYVAPAPPPPPMPKNHSAKR